MADSITTIPETCGLCGKRKSTPGQKVVKGVGGKWVCAKCIQAGAKIIESTLAVNWKPLKKIPRPIEIANALKQHVVGQEKALVTMALAAYEHYRRIECNGVIQFEDKPVQIEKSNVLVFGPTASGKTLISKTLSKILKVPFFMGDATRLTQAGYVGDDVDSLIHGLIADSKGNFEAAERGIIVLDEFDKIARKTGRSPTGSRDVTGEGVQQSLLKLIEGSDIPLPAKAFPMKPAGSINTKHILFVCQGSFQGIEEIVLKRLNESSSLGFGSKLRRKELSPYEIYSQITEKDLIDYGFIPELVGRLPIRAATNKLTEDQLLTALNGVENSLISQTRALFSVDGVDLTFEQDALAEIAREAFSMETGARSLLGIIKRVTNPYYFDGTEKRVSITEKDVIASRE